MIAIGTFFIIVTLETMMQLQLQEIMCISHVCDIS